MGHDPVYATHIQSGSTSSCLALSVLSARQRDVFHLRTISNEDIVTTSSDSDIDRTTYLTIGFTGPGTASALRSVQRLSYRFLRDYLVPQCRSIRMHIENTRTRYVTRYWPIDDSSPIERLAMIARRLRLYDPRDHWAVLDVPDFESHVEYQSWWARREPGSLDVGCDRCIDRRSWLTCARVIAWSRNVSCTATRTIDVVFYGTRDRAGLSSSLDAHTSS